MPISKQDYIYRSLNKLARAHKGWEIFVVSRILHSLDDDEIEFITSQVVARPNGKRALTDIYFPQFSLHVEVDEGYHDSTHQLEADELREQDIVQITGHKIERVKITDGKKATRKLADIRQQVDDLVEKIRGFKKSAIKCGDFVPWDLETRYLADSIIKKGFLDVKDNVVFQVQIEAMKCFGFKGKGFQRGAWRIPDGTNDSLWFPRLYRHGMWHNQLINGGKTIIEEAIDEDGIASIKVQKKNELKFPNRKHIVFAKSNNPLGYNLLRFVGTFKFSLEESTSKKMVFNRISTRENVRLLE